MCYKRTDAREEACKSGGETTRCVSLRCTQFSGNAMVSCNACLVTSLSMCKDLQCSFHKGDGFFPGTGDEDDIGEQLGYGYSVNVPLKVCASNVSCKQSFSWL